MAMKGIEFQVVNLDDLFTHSTHYVGEEEICPKCGKPLIKDENGECIECNRKPYFIVEASKDAYEKIKSGITPFVYLPINGIARSGIVSAEIKQDDNGDFVTIVHFKYGIVKVKLRRSKKCISFKIYNVMLCESKTGETTIFLFLGEQVGIAGEEVTDKCDVDMKEKSKEFIKKFARQYVGD